MPLVATSPAAFIALLSDVPFALLSHGRKLYAHITPSSDETAMLLQRGWSLNAVLPGAYRPDIVTQQWGLDLDKEATMRLIRVKREFVEAIKAGRKTTEIRVGYDHIRTIFEGERLRFAARDISVVVEVKKVDRYDSFPDLLKAHRFETIAPRSTEGEVLSLLRDIYPANKEALGVYAFTIKPI